MLAQILTAAYTLLLAITSATPVPVKADTPIVCGSIDLANGVTQKLYEGACYEVEGSLNEIHVQNTCYCEFFPFKNCNAKPIAAPVLGDPVEGIQGYYCQKI